MNFNLNPDAYTKSELENLLNLKPNYKADDVINGKKTIINQLEKNKSLGAEERRNIMFFMDTISEELLGNINIKDLHDPNIGTWSEEVVPSRQYGSNILITNPNSIVGINASITEGRVTGEGGAPPGYINPINVRTVSQAVNIDSRFRKNYYKTTASDYSISLSEPQKKVISMRLAALELPTTWYAISRHQQNNSFLIIAEDKPTGGSFPALPGNFRHYAWLVTLPDGNYENWWMGNSGAISVIQTINNCIALAQPGKLDHNGVFHEDTILLTTSLNALEDIAFTIDQTSGKSIFARPNSDVTDNTLAGVTKLTIRFNINLKGSLDLNANIQIKLGWQLGFRAAQYNIGYGGDATSAAAVSEAPCFISGPRYGFISIEDYQKNKGASFVLDYGSFSSEANVIARINFSSVMFGNGVYQCADDPGLDSQTNRTREYFGPVDIQKLHIKIYDEYGRIIDFNNMDYSFTLTFEKLYE